MLTETTLRIDISPHSDTLFWFWANPSLLFLLNVLSGEATNTNFIVFGLTRSGLETHDLPHEHTNYNIPDAVVSSEKK